MSFIAVGAALPLWKGKQHFLYFKLLLQGHEALIDIFKDYLYFLSIVPKL